MSTQQEFICEFTSSSKGVISTSDLGQSKDKQQLMKSELLDEKMTLQEERDSLFQQNMNLHTAVKEMSEQMSVFKNRRAGVETVALLLRESKLDNIRLTKRCQVFETAISNLQKRLASNGLSSSVNMEESEIFVPGASKQTLDNLAKENARLRSQIKNSESTTGRKQAEEMHSMKAALEIVEAGNNQLKNQLIEMEDSKTKIIQQYEMELKSQKDPSVSIEKIDKFTDCKETQTDELGHFDVEAFKSLLSQVTVGCQHLGKQLEKTSEKSDMTEERFAELTKSYEQVFVQNRSQQIQLGQKEQVIQFLRGSLADVEGRIREMADPGQLDTLKKEIVMLRGMHDRKETENLQLRQEMGCLREEMGRLGREVMSKRSQPQFDASIVEILKQQIQVCTEDFNTERRDREQAVNKGKQLQEQVNRNLAEIQTLKAQVETLKKENFSLMQQTQPPRQTSPSIQARGLPPASLATPHPTRPSGSISSGNSYFSATSSPLSSYKHHSQPSTSSVELSSAGLGQSMNIGNTPGAHMQPVRSQAEYLLPPVVGNNEFVSLPRTIGGFDTERHTDTRPGLASMPPPRQSVKEKGEYFICPKCNKEFRDSQSEDLLAHMDVCTD